MASREEITAAQLQPTTGQVRWLICALLFFAASVNYMDRQVIGLLKPTLQAQLGWTEEGYSNIVVAFQLAYGSSLLFIGKLIDRIGTRKGFSLAVLFWSVSAMAHAGARSVLQFAVARFSLGVGEAGSFPASIKAVAEWFPKKERALATGIFNSGTNVGAMLAPVAVSLISARWGWRGSFVGVGALGFIWLILWLLIYRKPEEHHSLSRTELDYIRSDPQPPIGKTKWAKLFPVRQTWAFATGKFLTDPIWWFYLFWVPAFLQTRHGLNLTGITLPIVVVYFISDVGSVAGGWISSFLIKRGSSINSARKTAMLLCAVGVIPVVFAYRVESTWSAVALIGLAAACHQGFSANLYTITSDMFPARAVGSVTGIGGMAGAIGGMLFATVVGRVLQYRGSYTIPFFVSGCAYLLALGMIHVLAPRLEPARIE